ncbi:MAG: class I SAM-dependent rRNA methyltransferase [Alloprevotella sp.]|nr:class I SAM-dependent rRNA methyltransferase [Alloprevotella sp.]
MNSIQLKPKKEESLLRFHPWIFSGAIAQKPANLEEGEVVRVLSHSGDCLGVGHFQIGSIAVRMLSFDNRPIDNAFWKERIGKAYEMRRTTLLDHLADNNIYRLVHGEGDMLPGLIIDVYNHTAVVQAHSVGMHKQREDIAKALVEVLGNNVENVYYKSETTLPYKANLHEKEGFLIGNTNENVAKENGLQFHIDWLKGQKTGFFVDQRENRHLLEKYAKGRRVLNLFCYTGGFSVYALRGGAEYVCSIDSSEKAIELTRQNVALNFPDTSRHEAYAEDAFKYLQQNAADYDLMVLDPPAFAKHRDALRNAAKGYIRLNAAAFRQIRPGGIVFTFSCSQAVSKEQFRLFVFTAAQQSGRKVRILHQLHQPIDHPINIYHPEGEYLKGLVLFVE